MTLLGDPVEVSLQRRGIVDGSGIADADGNPPEVGGEFGRVGIPGVEPVLAPVHSSAFLPVIADEKVDPAVRRGVDQSMRGG